MPKPPEDQFAPLLGCLALLGVGALVLCGGMVSWHPGQADKHDKHVDLLYEAKPRAEDDKAVDRPSPLLPPASTPKPEDDSSQPAPPLAPAPAPKVEKPPIIDPTQALLASGLTAFQAGHYEDAEVAWQQALLVAQQPLADKRQLADIVFRLAAVAQKLARSEDARILAAQANDLWTQARLPRQARLTRRKELQVELGLVKRGAGQ